MILSITLICEDSQDCSFYERIINNILLFDNYSATLISTYSIPEYYEHFSSSIFPRNYHSQLALLSPDYQNHLYVIVLHRYPLERTLTLLHRLRNYSPRCFIILITRYKKLLTHIVQAHIELLDFITPTDTFTITLRIRQCIQSALKHCLIPFDIHPFTFPSNYQLIRIPCPHINYICKSSNQTLIATLHCTYHTSMTLKKCAALLPNYFLYCSKSSIINTMNIQSIDRQEQCITFQNNQSCPASKHGLQAILKHIEKPSTCDIIVENTM